MEELVFQSHPDVVIGGNTFRKVPTILQFAELSQISSRSSGEM